MCIDKAIELSTEQSPRGDAAREWLRVYFSSGAAK